VTSSVAASDVTTGGHYALSALFDIKEIEDIIAKNIPVESKVALAVAKNPGALKGELHALPTLDVQCISLNPVKLFLHICLWQKQPVSHPKNE
jgi:hypothetical protein